MRVGAGLGVDDDGGARRPAVFGGVRARHHLELVDRVNRRPRDLRGQFLDVGREAVVGDAVEQEVVLQAAIAVHADAAGAARRSAARLLGVAIALHAGHQREQVVPIANRERQLRHFIAGRRPCRRTALSVLSSGVTPCTVTVSPTDPTASDRSRRERAPISSATVCSKRWKPGASTWTRYSPGARFTTR